MGKMNTLEGEIHSPDGIRFRLTLTAIVLLIYFGCFYALLMRVPAAASTEGAMFGSMAIVVCCMIGSIATTAIFVFARRGE